MLRDSILLFLITISVGIANAQESTCDTSYIEAKIDSLSAQTATLNSRVQSVESTVVHQENQTRSSITSTLLNFPIFFVEKIFTYLVLGILDLDSDTSIFSIYHALYTAKPDLSPLEGTVSDLSKMLLGVYVLVIVLQSLKLLYDGAIGRSEIKENLARIFLGVILLRSSFWIYTILINITTGITQLFVGYIDFGLLSLNTKTVLLNLDVITIFIVVFIILGLICGAIVYITTFFGLLVFPLILLCMSMPFERVRAFGESLLSGIFGILLAPAISASILAVIPFALQSGQSNFLMNRAILLAGILLAIIIPFFVIISLFLKPVVKVVAFTKIAKMVVK